jgi:hypothetical protein
VEKRDMVRMWVRQPSWKQCKSELPRGAATPLPRMHPRRAKSPSVHACMSGHVCMCEHARVCVCALVCMCEHACAREFFWILCEMLQGKRIRACRGLQCAERLVGGASGRIQLRQGIWTLKRLNKVRLW